MILTEGATLFPLQPPPNKLLKSALQSLDFPYIKVLYSKLFKPSVPYQVHDELHSVQRYQNHCGQLSKIISSKSNSCQKNPNDKSAGIIKNITENGQNP